MTVNPALATSVTAVVALVCSTVAVALHAIDGQTYAAIVGVFGGAGIGVGAHSAGVGQGKST